MNGRNVFLSGIMAAVLAGCVANPEPPAGGAVPPVKKGPATGFESDEFTITLIVGGSGAAG